MIIVISMLLAILFVLLAAKTLRKNPIPFYIGAVCIALTVLILNLTDVTFSGIFGTYIYPLFDKAAFASSLFILVMMANAFDAKTRAYKLLMPLRGPLSIIASILTLGHNAAYGKTYFVMLFTDADSMPTNQMLAARCSLCMLVIMLPLFVTSFICIRKKMQAKSWKRLQRFAYGFYALLYLHVMFLNLPYALRGNSRNIVNVCVYSLLFLTYLCMRLEKALLKHEKSKALKPMQEVTAAICLLLSVGSFFLLNSIVKEENIQAASPEAETENSSEEASYADGIYQATVFGYTGEITVEVIIENGEVVDVYFADYEDDTEYKHYSDDLIEAICESPYEEFDTITGATFSTSAVKRAYGEALKQALSAN